MRILLYLVLLFLGRGITMGQSVARVSIQGIVLDSSTQQPILQATVTLQLRKDSLVVRRQLTDAQGKFFFKNLDKKEYRLLITSLGYQTYSQLFLSTDLPSVINGGKIMLSLEPRWLNEVRVQRRLPARIKNDTLEFDAASYMPTGNTVVEDLLRAMPGIDINPDGSVRATGQVVSQIFVDGKPFFGADVRMATRNLPARLIDKVQVFDKRSDQSEFSGLNDGHTKKTINIITKPQGKKGVFGQQAAGYGSQNRYQLGGGIHQFKPNRQVSLIGQSNNINQLGYSLSNMGNQNTENWDANSSQGLLTGISQAKGFGINYSDQLGKSTQLSSSYVYTDAVTISQQMSRRQMQAPSLVMSPDTTANPTYIINENQNRYTVGNKSHTATIRLEHKVDSTNIIRFTPSFTLFQINSHTQIDARTSSSQTGLLNQSGLNNQSTSINFTFSNAFLWMHRFKHSNRTLSVNIMTNLNRTNTEGINHSVVHTPSIARPDTLQDVLTDQSSLQQLATQVHQLSIAYAQPIGIRQSLELRYTFISNGGSSDRFVADVDPGTGLFDRANSNLSNQYQSHITIHQLGSTWQIRQPRYTYLLGIDFQQAYFMADLGFASTSLRRKYFNWLPHLMVQPKLGPNQNLQAHYQTSLVMPTVIQLQPVTDVTNPLFHQVGNPTLRPEYTHLLTVTYNRFQPSTFRSIYALVNIGMTQDRITTATKIDAVGVQTSQLINRNGYWTINGMLTIGRSLQLGALQSRANWTTTLHGIRSSTYINNEINRSISLYASQGLGLSATLPNQLEINLSGAAIFQQAFYSLSQQNNFHALNTRLAARLVVPLPLEFKLSTDMAMANSTGLASGYNQRYTLWNGYLSRSFLKQQQGELRLQGFDLLNQNRSVVRTITESYIEDVRGQVLNRYFLLSLIYNLQQFGTTK